MSTQETEGDESTDDSPVVRVRIDADPLDTALRAASAVPEEGVITFDGDGMHITSMDLGNVTITDVTIPADAFEEFETTGLRIGVQFENLKRLASSGDETVLEWDSDAFRLSVESGHVDAQLSTVDPGSVRTLEIDAELMDDSPAVFETVAGRLREAVTTVKNVTGSKSAYVIVGAGESGFVGLKRVGDTDKVSVSVADGGDVTREPSGNETVTIDTEYLSTLVGAIPTDAEIEVFVWHDNPLVVRYDVDDVSVRMVQAPRIGTD